MVLNQTNDVFSHLHLIDVVITHASLGKLEPDPGVQLRKIMQGENGDIVALHALQQSSA